MPYPCPPLNITFAFSGCTVRAQPPSVPAVPKSRAWTQLEARPGHLSRSGSASAIYVAAASLSSYPLNGNVIGLPYTEQLTPGQIPVSNGAGFLAVGADGSTYVGGGTPPHSTQQTAIAVFASNWSIPPMRVLNCNLIVSDITVDAAGYLYVAGSQTAGPPFSILIYAPGAQGNDSPIQIIAA